MNDETLKDHLDNDKEELKLKSQLINALQVFDLLPYEQDSKYGSGKANKEDYWRKCEKAIDQYTQSKLKAFAGEVEKAIGIPTQTFHTESGLSDATDTQINIAVDDMITWIKNGGSIDKKEREWFKSRTVEQVPKDLQAKGANLLRKEVLEALKAIKEKAGIE